MSKWEQIKELKGLITSIVAVAVVVIGASGYVMNLTINDKVAKAVAAELAKQDLGTDEKIVAMDKVSAENKRTGEENAKDITGLESRVQLAFKTLMGRPPPDDGQ